MKIVAYLPSFERDVAEIWADLAEHDPRAADKLIDRIYERCSQLAAYPEMGPARPDIAPACRHLVIRTCVALYRIVDDRVEMVRVFRKGKELTRDVFTG